MTSNLVQRSAILSLGLAASGVLSLCAPVAAALPVTASYATYRLARNHDSCYTEYYYQVTRSSLEFVRLEPDSIWQAQFRAILIVTDTAGHPIDTVAKLVGTQVHNPDEARRRDIKIIDILPLYLKAGTYRAELEITDMASGDQGRRVDELIVRDMGAIDSLMISDLQFAYSLQPVTDDQASPASAKYKNGYLVEPNPSDVFAPEDSILFLYGELYNLATMPDSYSVHMWILDDYGDIVRDMGTEWIARPGENALLVYGIPLADLLPDQWHVVAVEVDQGEATATARRRFLLGTGAVKPVEEEFTEEQAELNRKLIAYIATAEELTEYRALGLEGKRRFLADFWRRRDPDPATPQNEYFESHVNRFGWANLNYSRTLLDKTDGWNTDRGRVIILYGEPDEVVQSPSAIGTWAWERWEYQRIEGGVYFIFLDWKNLGDYRLMHSTKQGERFDPEWQRKIDYEGLDILNR